MFIDVGLLVYMTKILVKRLLYVAEHIAKQWLSDCSADTRNRLNRKNQHIILSSLKASQEETVAELAGSKVVKLTFGEVDTDGIVEGVQQCATWTRQITARPVRSS